MMLVCLVDFVEFSMIWVILVCVVKVLYIRIVCCCVFNCFHVFVVVGGC